MAISKCSLRNSSLPLCDGGSHVNLLLRHSFFLEVAEISTHFFCISFSDANALLWKENFQNKGIGSHVLGGGCICFWQSSWWLAHIWMKLAKCWEQQIGALCSSCSQSNPGPKQSWKGSNTPSSCRNGKRSGFSCLSLFVLFLYFVTWETPGNGLCWSQLRSPEAGWMLSPSQQSSALCCTSTAAAWSSAELEDNLRGGRKVTLTACCVVLTNHLQHWTVLMGVLLEGNGRFSCLHPAQGMGFLFVFSLSPSQS